MNVKNLCLASVFILEAAGIVRVGVDQRLFNARSSIRVDVDNFRICFSVQVLEDVRGETLRYFMVSTVIRRRIHG